MPICKKCKENFPTRAIVNGKRRVLNKRKYCLNCLPFGEHSTRYLNDSYFVNLYHAKTEGIEVICSICNRKYIYHRKSGHTKSKCNSCLVNKRKLEVKIKALKYKGDKCLICKYKKCKNSLVFHHKNPKNKKFSLSGNHTLAWKRIEKELDKCVLLCLNCHGEVHAGLHKKLEIKWLG